MLKQKKRISSRTATLVATVALGVLLLLLSAVTSASLAYASETPHATHTPHQTPHQTPHASQTPHQTPHASQTPHQTPHASQTPHQTPHASQTPHPNPTHTPQPAGHLEVYGLVESLPAEFVGEWLIDGVTYAANTETQFFEHDGPLAVGACVAVKYLPSSNLALQIRSQEAHHCTGGSFTNDVYGTVESFPDDLYGTWVISGLSYLATPSTHLEQEHGSFAVTACVKVKYYTQNGVNYATQIKSQNPSHCDGTELPSSTNSYVYATIDNFPASPYVGAWVIGGLTYEATATTQFDQDHAPFAIGTCVKAKYSDANDSNTLLKVETKQAYKCQNSNTSYGTVATVPTNPDWTGTWQIGGVTYQADNATTFSEAFGLLASGAYVEVKYDMSGRMSVPVASSIKTHVAPNSGLDRQMGHLTDYDTNDEWNDWVVDGLIYRADPAIEVGTESQAPQIGQFVVINSYESDGSRYITSATAAQQLFLPAITR